MAACPPGAKAKLPPVPVAIFMLAIRSVIGRGASSSSSEEHTTFRNRLPPVGGLLALGEREKEEEEDGEEGGEEEPIGGVSTGFRSS